MHSSILYGAAKRGHTLPQQQSTPQLSPPPPRPHLSNSPPLFAAADQWLKRSFLNDKAHAEEDLQEALKEALAEPIDLNRAQYEALHDGREVPELSYQPRREFVITHVGERYDANFQDLGVEYYHYVAV